MHVEAEYSRNKNVRDSVVRSKNDRICIFSKISETMFLIVYLIHTTISKLGVVLFLQVKSGSSEEIINF